MEEKRDGVVYIRNVGKNWGLGVGGKCECCVNCHKVDRLCNNSMRKSTFHQD